MSKISIWMALYVGDYLADTGHLSLLEHGAYLRLLMAAWTRGGTLPGDDASLARLIGATRAEWNKTRSKILPFFDRNENGTLTQKRLAMELERAQVAHEKRVSAGRAGGRPPKQPEGNALAMRKQRGTQPPSQSPKALTPLAHPDGFAEFWIAYPRKKGKKDSLRAWRKLNPGPALRIRILSAVAAQSKSIDWTKDDGQYIPYPASWLNGERWEDSVVNRPIPERTLAL